MGGDGTSYEIVNGLFPRSGDRRAARARIFAPGGRQLVLAGFYNPRNRAHAGSRYASGRRRACDVIRLQHTGGTLYFMNLLSLGFPADAGETANRRFKRWGELGYIFAVLARLAALKHAAFPHRFTGEEECDRRPFLFLAFSNSKFTGGKMMIAPKADPADGLIECVRWLPVGRMQLLWNFPSLFSGTHIDHALASRGGTARVDFALDGPVTAMVDGEILRIECRSLEVLPGALDVMV